MLYESMYGNGWAWKGPNGSFTVRTGDNGPIVADGIVFAKLGDVDFRSTLDKTKVDTSRSWDFSTVGFKCSTLAWAVVNITPAGNTYVFTLSDVIGPGRMFPHSGLLNPGDKPECVWVIGGKECKDAAGVTFEYKSAGGSWTPR